MCSGFWIGTVSGAAVRGVLGEDRRMSGSGYLDLAGEEVIFFTCSRHYGIFFPPGILDSESLFWMP